MHNSGVNASREGGGVGASLLEIEQRGPRASVFFIPLVGQRRASSLGCDAKLPLSYSSPGSVCKAWGGRRIVSAAKRCAGWGWFNTLQCRRIRAAETPTRLAFGRHPPHRFAGEGQERASFAGRVRRYTNRDCTIAA